MQFGAFQCPFSPILFGLGVEVDLAVGVVLDLRQQQQRMVGKPRTR